MTAHLVKVRNELSLTSIPPPAETEAFDTSLFETIESVTANRPEFIKSMPPPPPFVSEFDGVPSLIVSPDILAPVLTATLGFTVNTRDLWPPLMDRIFAPGP